MATKKGNKKKFKFFRRKIDPVEQSNKCHEKLCNKAHDRLMKNRKMEDYIRVSYHTYVQELQKEKKKVLSQDERRKIYTDINNDVVNKRNMGKKNSFFDN